MSMRPVLALSLAGATAVMGCGGAPLFTYLDYVATDGSVVRTWQGEGHYSTDAERERTVRASGAHDLQCAPDQLTVRELPSGRYAPHESAADGCGQRAVYKFLCGWDRGRQTCTAFMTARFNP